MKKCKYTHIIWDFNGTILDDVQAGIKSINTLLAKRGLKTIASVEEYRSVFGFPIVEYYRRVGFDFEKEAFDIIAPEWVEQYMINVKESSIYADVEATIEEFCRVGVQQVVLSATELNMLNVQLQDLGIQDRFNDVFGLGDIHAASKAALAREWRKNNPLAKALFIGDTIHDAEVAREAEADCVLVARGHQSYETLSKCGVPVVYNLREVVALAGL